MLPVSAAGVSAVAGCAPEDEGFGNGAPVRAEDGSIPLEDLPENTGTLVNFGGDHPFVLLVRGSGDEVTGYSGYCTHNGCALREKGEELDCPCHGSRFDPTTGEVLVGPATIHLPEVPVVVEDGHVRRTA